MEIINLTYLDMFYVYLFLILPVILLIWLKAGIILDLVVSISRMSVQLILIGIYLKFIFEINSLLLNIAWILAMLLVANFSILRQSNLSVKKFFIYTFLGLSFATSIILAIFVALIICPSPLYDARYMIPIFGMILGNSMRGNVIVLERFYSSIKKNESEFITYQMLGATLSESTKPYIRSALLAALTPQLSTIATMGIVSLPGMMTGQILGGSFPVNAIKYQIAIMVCIFSALICTTVFNLLLTRRIAFDSYGMLKHNIFRK
ncbi:MAG TPA: ABC transporter permease [Victivallales bacterium]|nr:ABC transporter permease [Victivallales bacterium]